MRVKYDANRVRLLDEVVCSTTLHVSCFWEVLMWSDLRDTKYDTKMTAQLGSVDDSITHKLSPTGGSNTVGI